MSKNDYEVYGMASVDVIETDGKPYLKIAFPSTPTVHLRITTNLAEMIGGVGKGARLRYEDKQKEKP